MGNSCWTPNTRSVARISKNNSEQQYVLVEEYETMLKELGDLLKVMSFEATSFTRLKREILTSQ